MKINRLLVWLCLVYALGCRGGKYLRVFEPSAETKQETVVEPERITAGIESNFSPNLSPNGAFVLYTSDRNGNKDIWEKRTNGGHPIQLTTHPADDFGPEISPDGRRAAFVSRRDDALGDIHFLELGATFSRLLGKYEGHVSRVELPNREDSWPAWFSNSKQIVFSSRAVGQSESMLYTAKVGDLVPTPLDQVEGEQPTVSPDDKWIAYVRGGQLWLYDLEKKRKYKLTDAPGIQNGQPSFSSDGQHLVFLRFSEDSNRDGQINADDNATVWTLNIAQQLKSKNNLENFSLSQLTSSEYSAFRPALRPPFLFFARQDREGLNIFRLPAGGEITRLSTLKDALELVREAKSTARRLFILRHAQAQLATQKKWQDVVRLAMTELEILLDNDRIIESQWLVKKLKQTFPSNKAIHLYSTLFIEELSVKGLLLRPPGTRITDADGKKLEATLKRLNRIIRKFNQPEFRDVNIRATLLKAKILAASGDFAVANELLETLAESDPDNSNFNVAKALLFQAQLNSQLVGIQNGLRSTVNIARRYQSLALVVEDAARLAVRLAATTQNEVVSLQNLIGVAQGLSLYPAILHERVVELHFQNGREVVGANELKEMLNSYGSEPGVLLAAAERLGTFYETGNQLSEAEKVYKRLLELIPSGKTGEKARSMLSDFYLRRGERYLGQQDAKRAQANYQLVLKQDWRNVAAHVGLIDALALQDKLLTKREEYRKLYEERPRDPRRIFYYTYAKTFEISNMQTISAKTAVVDECIALLEDARQRNGQIAEIHQTLGWLYYTKGQINRESLEGTSFRAKFSQSWEITKDYFGFGEPQWFELSAESYLSAYFIAKEGSVTRTALSEKLGDTFYRLQNYSKSLNYYMQRLKLAQRTPLRSALAEAAIYRKAGKSAFYIEDLEVAEALHLKEADVWRRIGNDEGVARALDSLALTLRDAKKFDEALTVYKDLLQIQNGLGNPDNITMTLINLAVCSNETGALEQSLGYLEDAETRLRDSTRRTLSTHDRTIAVDLAGQGSDAYGFDVTTKLIMIETIKIDLYTKLARFDLALASQESKYELMLQKQKDGRDAGRGSNYYLDEISIALNHIGELKARQGDSIGAASAFLDAAETVKALRPKDRDYPTQSEWLNLINYGRIIVRLHDIGHLPADKLEQAAKLLTDTRLQLDQAFKDGDHSTGLALATLTLLSGKLAPENGRLFDQSLALYAQLGGGEAAVAEAFMASDLEGLKRNNSRSSLLFRRNVLSRDDLSFKLYAKMGRWKEAFASAVAHVKKGGSFALPNDRFLARLCFENALKDSVPDIKERAQQIRAYLDFRAMEIGFRNISGSSTQNIAKNQLQSLFDQKPLATTASDNLDPHQALLVAHQYIDGSWDVILQLPSSEARLMTGRGSRQLLRTINDSLQGAGPQVKEVYIVPSGLNGPTDWDKLVSRAGLSGYALLASPSLLQAHTARRVIPKASILHIAGKATRQTNAVKQSNQQRYYRLYSETHASPGEQFNLVHNENQLVLNPIEPLYSVIGVGKHKHSTQNLAEFSQNKTTSTGLYVFANSVRNGTSQIKLGEQDQVWIALELAGLMAGIPTLVIADANDSEKWQQFYREIGENTYATAFLTTKMNGHVVGYLGATLENELKYASNQISKMIFEGDDAFKRKAYGHAATAYKEAAYYAQRLGKTEDEHKLLESLIEALFLKRDFGNALQFQEQIIDRVRQTDPEQLGGAYLGASILALEASETGKARKLLNHAKETFQTYGDSSHAFQLLIQESAVLIAENKIEEAVVILDGIEAEGDDDMSLRDAKINLYSRVPAFIKQAVNLMEGWAGDTEGNPYARRYVELLIQMGKIEKARTFVDSLELTAIPLAMKIDVYGLQGDFQNASIALDLSAKDESPSQLKIIKAKLLMRQRSYNEALKLLLKNYFSPQLRENVDKVEMSRLIAICHEQMGHVTLAQDFFGTALQLAEASGDRDAIAQISYDLGVLYLNSNMALQSAESLERAIVLAGQRHLYTLKIRALLAKAELSVEKNKNLAVETAAAAYRLSKHLGHQGYQWRAAFLNQRLSGFNKIEHKFATTSFAQSEEVIELRLYSGKLGSHSDQRAFVEFYLSHLKSKDERLWLVDMFHRKAAPGYYGDARSNGSGSSLPSRVCALQFFQGENDLFSWLINSRGTHEFSRKVSRQQINGAVSEYLMILQNFANPTESVDRLKTLISATSQIPSHCETLVVVADASLHYLAFAHIFDEIPVFYATSISSLDGGGPSHLSIANASILLGQVSEDDPDFLVQKEAEFARSVFPEDGSDLIVDLREHLLTASRGGSLAAADVNYLLAGSQVQSGTFYLGSRIVTGNGGFTGEEVRGFAGMLGNKGFKAASIPLWRFDPMASALFMKHLQRGLSLGSPLPVVYQDVDAKIRAAHSHHASWGFTKLYLFDGRMLQ